MFKVKRYLRQNHWTRGCRTNGGLCEEFCRNENCHSEKFIYREILAKLSNENGNILFVIKNGWFKLNIFEECGGSCSTSEVNSENLNNYQLTETGKATLTRLLNVVKQTKPDYCSIPVNRNSFTMFTVVINFCQVLYPLAELFLNYMSEEEAFACLIKFLSHCQKYLIQTDPATSATNCILIELTKKHAVHTYHIFCLTVTTIIFGMVHSFLRIVLIHCFKNWQVRQKIEIWFRLLTNGKIGFFEIYLFPIWYTVYIYIILLNKY